MPSRELSKDIGARNNMKVAVDEDEWIMIDTIRRGMCTIGIVVTLLLIATFTTAYMYCGLVFIKQWDLPPWLLVIGALRNSFRMTVFVLVEFLWL